MVASDRQRRTRSRKKASPQTDIVIEHVRSPDLPAIYADGVLVRVSPPNIVLTFYTDDAVVSSEEAELLQVEGSLAKYRQTKINEQVVRTQRAEVRVSLSAVPGLVGLLRHKTREVFPEVDKAIDSWQPPELAEQTTPRASVRSAYAAKSSKRS